MRFGHQLMSKGRSASGGVAAAVFGFTSLASADDSPSADGAGFDRPEQQVFDGEADSDHGEQAREDVRRLERRPVLVNVPAEPPASRRDAEHQLGSDQGPPRVRPADPESSQDEWERRRNQNPKDIA